MLAAVYRRSGQARGRSDPGDADGMVVSELAAADVDAVVITRPSLPDRGGHDGRTSRRADRLGTRPRRADRRGRLRRGIPVRPGSGASLQGLAPDLVAFVGTASKTLAPALRLAWVVPPSHLIDDVEDVLLVTGVTPPTLDQVALASFIEDAALERHLRSMRGAIAPSGTCWSASSASTCPRSASVAPRPDCTCSPGPPRTRTSTRRRGGPGTPASACTSCTATAPRTRRPLPRSCSALLSRANRT